MKRGWITVRTAGRAKDGGRENQSGEIKTIDCVGECWCDEEAGWMLVRGRCEGWPGE